MCVCVHVCVCSKEGVSLGGSFQCSFNRSCRGSTTWQRQYGDRLRLFLMLLSFWQKNLVWQFTYIGLSRFERFLAPIRSSFCFSGLGVEGLGWKCRCIRFRVQLASLDGIRDLGFRV